MVSGHEDRNQGSPAIGTEVPPFQGICHGGSPRATYDVIATGMAKDPDQRYATTLELADAARGVITVPIQRSAPNPAPPPPVEQTSSVTAPWVPHDQPPQRPQPLPGALASATTQHSFEPFPTHLPQSGSAAMQDHPTVSAARLAGSPPIPVDTSLTQRRKRRTKTALITGGVAIITIAAVFLGVLMWTGWLSKIFGPPSPTTSTPPPPVAAGALDGLLLSTDQIDTAMGTTGMTVINSDTNLVDDTAHISDKNCLAVYDGGELPVYAGSRWTAIRGQLLHQPGDTWTAYVHQAVVLFPDATDAAAFFNASETRWQSCANRQYTFTPAGLPPTNWTVRAVSNTNGTLTVRQTEEGGNDWACQRALTVRNNVAVDVLACGYSQGDFGLNIAHQIAHKVPNQ
jgi:serine/threonine kinase PknH